MPAINYLAEIDKIRVKKDLAPFVFDMNERELRVALLNVLHGMDVYKAIDTALMPPKFRKK